eukprot:jgi/Hompol1/5553/HPOL_004573-RA
MTAFPDMEWVVPTTLIENSVLKEALSHAKQLLAQQWTPLFETKGVKGTTTTALKGYESPVPVTRGEMELPEGDGRAAMAEQKEILGDLSSIALSVQKGVWPVSPRDMIVAVSPVHYDAELNALLILQRSITHPSYPEVSGNVRGQLNVCLLMVRPPASPSSRPIFTYIIDVDTKGSIPSTLIKLVVNETPMCVSKMVEHVLSKGAPTKLFDGIGYRVVKSSFDAGTATAEFRVSVVDRLDTLFLVDTRVFPKGVKISLKGAAEIRRVSGNSKALRLVSSTPGEVEITVMRHDTGANAGDVFVNGALLA